MGGKTLENTKPELEILKFTLVSHVSCTPRVNSFLKMFFDVILQ